jgi:dihydropteroate synthase
VHLNCSGKLLNLDKPVVMGILNITPDSFYSKSRLENDKELLLCCEAMLQAGAAIVDLGGYSSRPGAEFVSEEEESNRILHSVKLLAGHFKNIVMSIDTFRSNIALKAIEYGASIINDISSGEEDPAMIPTIASLKVPYIIMHKRGTPKTMQQLTNYENVSLEVLDYLVGKTKEAEKLNIHDLIIDPGFGFAKTATQNYSLLNRLDLFKILEKPILVGISRKKMLQQVISSNAEGALNASSVAHTISLMKGANILRVHDVEEAVQCIKIVEMLKE